MIYMSFEDKLNLRTNAKGKGGGSTQTTIQKSDPWEGVQPYLEGGYERLGQVAQQPLEYFPGQTYADFNPIQESSMQQKLDYAGGIQPFVNDQLSANSYLSSGAPTPLAQRANMTTLPATASIANLSARGMGTDPTGSINSMMSGQLNPYTDQAADRTLNRLNRNFQDNVMPALGDRAEGAGQYGGSRQGIAEGLAAQGLQNASADALASIYSRGASEGMQNRQAGTQLALQQGNQSLNASNAAFGNASNLYNTQSSNVARGLAASPQTFSLGMMPANIAGQVGQAYQDQSNRAIGESLDRHNFGQNAEFNRLQNYLGTLNGAVGGTSTQIAPNPNQSNPAAGLLTAGLGLATGNPMMAIGGLGGIF